MARFVLNDEKKVNSYGFRILNAGIDLTRFNGNPIMLNQHENSTSSVVGRWKDIQIVDGKLTAESEFDNEDAEAKALAGKVERGFIKGASMGVSFNHNDMKLAKDGIYELTRCQLFEASICAIPSNENALSLFAQDGHRLDKNEITLQLSHFKKFTGMYFLTQLIEILGLPNEANENGVLEAVKTLVDSQSTEKEKKIQQMLELAVTEYNLDAPDVEFWREAAVKDFDRVESMLLAPAKKRIYLSKMVNNTHKDGEHRLSWTLEDYRKKDPKALENNPELFKKLFEQENKKH